MVSAAVIIVIVVVLILVIVGISVGIWYAVKSKNTTGTTGSTGSTGTTGGGTVKVYTIPAGATCNFTGPFVKFQTYTKAWILTTTIPAGNVIQVVSGFGDGTARLPAGNEIPGAASVGLLDYYSVPSTRTLEVYFPYDFRGGTLPNGLISSTNTTNYPLYVYYI